MAAADNQQRWPRGARISDAWGVANANNLERTTAWLMAGDGTTAKSAGGADVERGGLWSYITDRAARRELIMCPSDDVSDPMTLSGTVVAGFQKRNFSYS